MILSESGMVRAMNIAHKKGGYNVCVSEDSITMYCDYWFVCIAKSALPRKVLAQLVLHMGGIPQRDIPCSVEKDSDPQVIIADVYGTEVHDWTDGDDSETAALTPIIIDGWLVFQEESGAVHGVAPFAWNIVAVPYGIPTRVLGGDRLKWEYEDSFIIIQTRQHSEDSTRYELWETLSKIDIPKK